MFLRIILELMIVFVLVILTTYGWRPSQTHHIRLSEEERQVAVNLHEIVELLASDIGIRNYRHYENLNKAADAIQERFQKAGYDVERMSYEIEGKPFSNIIAQSRSVQTAKPHIIIGAHYDSCFNPGADDNASGVAAMLELARLLKDEELRTPLRFVAFVNEEPPFFQTEQMGSLFYARQAKQSGERIKAAKPFSHNQGFRVNPFWNDTGDCAKKRCPS